MRVERRKGPLLGIQRLAGLVRHPARTSRAKHIKPIQWGGPAFILDRHLPSGERAAGPLLEEITSRPSALPRRGLTVFPG